MRRLFLTGPIGCGKSTVLEQALGENLGRCGGFLTRRYREPALHFTLERPDGSFRQTFLSFPEGQPRLAPEVFSRDGVRLLEGRVLVLDEIGGLELLVPEFREALYRVLESDVPVIGVLKGAGGASAMIRRLGLTRAYEEAAGELEQFLQADGDTCLYVCGQYDAQALALAREWVKEYVYDGIF